MAFFFASMVMLASVDLRQQFEQRIWKFDLSANLTHMRGFICKRNILFHSINRELTMNSL
jgi:hypothetical protein